MTDKKPAGTIDLTPTWSAVLPILLAAIEHGSSKGAEAARAELTRMAQLADAYVEHMKVKGR